MYKKTVTVRKTAKIANRPRCRQCGGALKLHMRQEYGEGGKYDPRARELALGAEWELIRETVTAFSSGTSIAQLYIPVDPGRYKFGMDGKGLFCGSSCAAAFATRVASAPDYPARDFPPLARPRHTSRPVCEHHGDERDEYCTSCNHAKYRLAAWEDNQKKLAEKREQKAREREQAKQERAAQRQRTKPVARTRKAALAQQYAFEYCQALAASRNAP